MDVELKAVVTETVAPFADDVDRLGRYPREGVRALLEAGFGGLVSAEEVGGSARGFGEAVSTVRTIAASCGSTAMAYTMHLCGTAAIEALGDDETRRAIGGGQHLTTLAFSERGSRSHFWAPMSSATRRNGGAVLNAAKSWVTSSNAADTYVWTSRPLGDEGVATMWLVPSSAPGLVVGGPFDGLGLRGNDSNPVTATEVQVPADAQLGPDGQGVDLALSHVLPWFLVLSAAVSVGLSQAALANSRTHLLEARLEHLDQRLADQDVLRQRLGRAENLAHAASTLLDDAADALDSGRSDATLRALQAKSVAADSAIDVTGEAMRIGGGAAFRRDIGIERYFRDAQAASVMAPTSDKLRDMIARATLGRPLL